MRTFVSMALQEISPAPARLALRRFGSITDAMINGAGGFHEVFCVRELFSTLEF